MRGAGVPGLRGLGVYGKDGVPGSSVQKTGSQGLLKTRGLSFLWLNDQNTQNINVIHYTGFKANWLKLAIKLRIPSFSTARNACMRGMFPDWPVWILFPREIWLHKPSEKSIDILSVKWEKSHFPLNVHLWIASQLCEAGVAFKIQQPLKLFILNRILWRYSELPGGEKWRIKERLKWEFWISGAAKYFLENRKVVVKRFSGEGKAFNKAGIGSDCRSDPIRTGMFAFGAEELFWETLFLIIRVLTTGF